MADYEGFLNEGEKRALEEGDNALRRSQALSSVVRLAEELGFSEELTGEVVGRLRERFDTLSDKDTRKIAKAMGRASGLLTTQTSVPVEAEPKEVPFYEEFAAQWKYLIRETVVDGYSALEAPLRDYLNPTLDVEPDEDTAQTQQSIVEKMRYRIQEIGELQTVADFTSKEIINLRMLLGWYRSDDGDNMKPGLPVSKILYAGRRTKAERQGIESALQSGLQKLTEAVTRA